MRAWHWAIPGALLAGGIAFAVRRPPPASAPPPTETIATPSAVAPPVPSEAAPPASLGAPPLPKTVDLEAVRKKLPENLYFRLAAPTTDAVVLAQREAESRAWNDLFGKVQSNTASEPEIARYYEHRRKLSSDYALFARTVLADFGPKLTEDERNLYELGARMNEQRLKQLPTEEARAVERHRAYEAKKRGR